MYPFERFTEGARRALTRAQQEAVAADRRFIGTEDLALALVLDDGAAGRVLRDLGVTCEVLRGQVRRVLESGGDPGPPRIVPTSRVKRVIEVAFQEATSAGAERVGTEHLLLGLMIEAEGVAALALEHLGATLRKVRAAVRDAAEDPPEQHAGIVEATTVARAIGSAPVPGAPVGTSSSLGGALLRAGQLAREEGITDIRADHLLRAIAATDAADLCGVLDKLGLAPEAVLAALAVPDDIRQRGLAAQRARVEHAAACAADGEAEASALRELLRLGREYSEAVSRWLGDGRDH